jgi:adenylate kinase
MAEGTPLGVKARPFVEQGRLVPDELVVDLVRERVAGKSRPAGFVLDGFPRTVAQADALDRALGAEGVKVVVYFLVDDETIVRRSLGRGRADDTEPVIRERLREYHARTEPLVQRYRSQGLLETVDASGTIEEVEAATRAAVACRAGPAK